MAGSIKNLKEAGDRIKQAVKDNERIIVYGDADLDGVSAVIIAAETIRNLGGLAAAFYFPDREAEGYGVTKAALEKLKDLSPALLVALDLGIGNFNEMKVAREMGFSTLIVDHHEILDGVPEADIVVDPKQPGDESESKQLCAAGLAFKLAEVALGANFTSSLRENFVELAALATLADMMPKSGENTNIIEEGLNALRYSYRPGLRTFFETDVFFDFEADNFYKKVGRIISVLNIRDTKEGVPAAFRLLTAATVDEAKVLIAEFIKINELRKEKIKITLQEIEARAAQKNEQVIFEGSETWESNLLGTIASILCQKYQKPTFIYKQLANESQGTVRSIDSIDSVALMKNCKDLLITFGGHPKASGFRLKNENLEKFKECLVKNL